LDFTVGGIAVSIGDCSCEIELLPAIDPFLSAPEWQNRAMALIRKPERNTRLSANLHCTRYLRQYSIFV
jgi:hypothetical protein